jgi:predicted DNA-binding protein YlxM (UPF0122 family)
MSTVIGDYFTVSELAAELGVTRQRVHGLLHTYNIPIMKPHPRLTLIPKKEARRLLKLDRPTGRHVSQK